MIPFSKRPARGLEASELIKTEDIEAWRKSGARPTSRGDDARRSVDEDRTRIMVDPKNPGSPANGVKALTSQSRRKAEAELEKTNLRGMVTRGRGVDEMTMLRPQTSTPETRSPKPSPNARFSPPPQAAPQQPVVAQPPQQATGQGFVSPGVLPAVAQAVAPAVANAVAAAVVQAVGQAMPARPPMSTVPQTGSHRGPARPAKFTVSAPLE